MSDNERSPSPRGEFKDDESSGPRDGSDGEGSRPQVAGKKRPRIADPDEEDVRSLSESPDRAHSPQGIGADGKEDVEGGEDENVDEDEDDKEDDKEDDEEDDEEEDDDDEDEDEAPTTGERRKKRRRKSKKYRFLDVEAEVDDEADEEDEQDDYGDVADFIDEAPESEAAAQTDYAHRQLDRAQGRKEEESVEQIVQRLKEKHGRMAGARYNADSDQVPQRLLMPGVNDPSLWTVRVKPGREHNISESIFRKVFEKQYSANPIEVLSVFYRSSLPGMIFVEARQAASVSQALLGIIGVFISRGVNLVPIEEMAPLLRIKKQDVHHIPGMWLRIRRGKNTGDLAQVVDIDQITSGVVGIKFIPRIDLTPKEKKRERGANGKGGLGGSTRPPARLFNYDDVRKIYGMNAVKQGREGSYLFDNDEFVDGFCYKDVKIGLVTTEDVKPTLEEISRFSGDDASTARMDLSAIADANKNLTVSVLFPGDKVEVYEGEQTGLYGSVVAVTADIISVRAEGGEIHGQVVEVSSKSVRKRFDVGEHVKVLAGKNANVSGMVVRVKGDVVTLMSDQGEQEIQVFSKDIRKAADLAGTTQQAGMYDVHDMVMLDSATAGVITKVEGGILRILDQNGAVRVVSPQQVQIRRENKDFAVAADSQGNDMRVGDAMKESDGERRSGEVINIFRSLFVFLFNRELPENHGVFVARASALVFVTPKSVTSDLGKLNPALQQQLPMGGASLMPPPATTVNRGRLINTLVVIVKGTHKGLMGVIKDILGEDARVELATNNRVVSINMMSLKRKDPKTGLSYPLETGGSGAYGGRPAAGGYDVNPYNGAPLGPPNGATPGNFNGRTPSGRFGQTPNPYAMPGIAGGKTPGPYGAAAGGKTPGPGWASAGGKTPGLAAGGGRTPGWAAVGGKTPGPGYADGGRTPAFGGLGGGKTPNAIAGGKTPIPYAYGAAGGRTPAPTSSMYGQGPEPSGSRMGNGTGAYNAPTPFGGPTPGAISAPSPAVPSANPYSASTPYGAPTPFSAPTPFNAPTPAAPVSAPTPGIGVPTPYGAPTPYPATPSAGPSNGLGHSASAEELTWDWALDFRNVVVVVGPSSRPGTRQPLHFQRGAYDGKKFGYEISNDETVSAFSLDEPSLSEEIPAEYLRPARPDRPGQVVVCIAGGMDVKGQQRMTAYFDEGQWMMEAEAGDVAPLVLSEESLCRIWKTPS